MTHPVLVGLAEKYNATVEQIMLAWNIRDGYTIAIPRSGKAEHTLQNAGADLITLSEEDYQAIDRAFPKPVKRISGYAVKNSRLVGGCFCVL